MKIEFVHACLHAKLPVFYFTKIGLRNYEHRKVFFLLLLIVFQLPVLLNAQPYVYATFNSPTPACTFPANACSGTGTWPTATILSNFTYSVNAPTARIDDVSYTLSTNEMPLTNAWETKYGNITTSTSCLRPRITSNASTAGSPLSTPLTTTITFATVTPVTAWGFMLLDLDVDEVDVKAKKADGTYYTNAQVNAWFKGVFDANTSSGASSSAGAVEPPCWDATNATLVGSEWVASPCARITKLGVTTDYVGAGGYFEPNLPIKSLEFVYYSLQPTATPSHRIFISASTTIPVPVTLVYFNAYNSGNSVKLNWSSEEEAGLNFYEIQKSNDGINFDSITAIEAKNIYTRHNYTFTDNSHYVQGKIFYRLKMIDDNGKYRYSNIASVLSNNSSEPVFLYPNPAGNSVMISNMGIGLKQIEVYSISGNLINSYTTHNTQQEISVSKMLDGIYCLKVTNGKDIQVLKLKKK